MSEKVGALPVKTASQAAYVAGVQVSSVPVKVFGLDGTHKGGGASWLQLFDSATPVAEGTVPRFTQYITSASNFNLDFGFHGMDFNNGLYVCHSSTAATKTIGAADIQVYARLTPDY